PNVNWESMWEATIQTAYMTAISVLATFILGILLGLLLFLTGRGNIWENKFVNSIIAGIVNLFRSIPFIILIILLIPLSVYIIGTMLGANAALPALIA
ncbi:ABC transporter permease, partial [Micrococcus sp. SIMBA_131]